MIVLNAWMLKAKNGMYWYAVDYMERTQLPYRAVIRRGFLDGIARQLKSKGIEVCEVGFGGFIAAMIRARLRGDLLFTPTPHPVPFFSRQIIVLHDVYPFRSTIGKLKAALLRWGIASSNCLVAHVNRSLCLPFLSAMNVPRKRLLFAPNIPPRTACAPSRRSTGTTGPARVVGAFGTDSAKKNYDLLLRHPDIQSGKIRLRIYGFGTPYLSDLQSSYGEHAFDVCDPESMSIREFLDSVDSIASVADGEGFGRPLAAAICAQIPCHLLTSPVFLEFFYGLADIYNDIDSLIAGIQADQKTPRADLPTTGFLDIEYGISIDRTVEQMRRLGQ